MTKTFNHILNHNNHTTIGLLLLIYKPVPNSPTNKSYYNNKFIDNKFFYNLLSLYTNKFL